MAKSVSVKERLEARESAQRTERQPDGEPQSTAIVAGGDGQRVTLELPLGELPTHVNQGPLRCDVRLSRHQSNVLRRLAVGLDLRRAKTGDGRRVTEGNWRAALQWLLDQVEA